MINYNDNLISYRRKKKKKNHKIVLGAIYSPTNNFTLDNNNTLDNKNYFKLNKPNRNKQEKAYLTKKRLNIINKPKIYINKQVKNQFDNQGKLNNIDKKYSKIKQNKLKIATKQVINNKQHNLNNIIKDIDNNDGVLYNKHLSKPLAKINNIHKHKKHKKFTNLTLDIKYRNDIEVKFNPKLLKYSKDNVKFYDNLPIEDKYICSILTNGLNINYY